VRSGTSQPDPGRGLPDPVTLRLRCGVRITDRYRASTNPMGTPVVSVIPDFDEAGFFAEV